MSCCGFGTMRLSVTGLSSQPLSRLCHPPTHTHTLRTVAEGRTGGRLLLGLQECACLNHCGGLALSLMQQLLLQYMDRMSVPPSRALDEVLLLPPIVLLFRGGRISGRYLGLDEVLRVGLNRIG